MALLVLIADDEPAARRGMSRALSKLDCEVLEVEDGDAALQTIRSERPALVFLDLNMPKRDGRGVLEALGEAVADQEIIVVTANDTLESAISCMRLGAADYITKPFEVEQIRAIARRNADRVRMRRKVDDLQRQLDDERALGALVGVSRGMRQLFAQIERAASAPMDVLIVGETGTGKELIARELHRLSPRAAGPFVAVNTSAVQSSLAESELFGHVKGAFTGATGDREGVFQRASGGTLFLDEIGDMPADLQAKLLRVLQERSVQPVGGGEPIPVDVRVVSATHQDLAAAIADGGFRQDLFYRIKGITLSVPPLRHRREDIILLCDYFLDRLSGQTGRDLPRLGADAIEALVRHTWPGNVRELEQLVTAAASMTLGDLIGANDLDLQRPPAVSAEFDLQELMALPLTEGKSRLVESFERAAIEAALTAEHGNVSAAARRLGIHRQSLQQKIAALGVLIK